jgi:restriction endonuclease S subunit
MELRPLFEFIEQQKSSIELKDSEEYTRATVKIHRKGIIFRGKLKGLQIKTKKQQICHKNQLLVAEIDAKVGGYGIVPEELEGSIVSSHYFLFNVDENKLLVDYLKFILITDDFFSQIKAQGSTNYASIRPKDVLKIKIPYCDINEQKQIVKRLNVISLNKLKVSINLTKSESLLFKFRQAILSEAVQGKLVPQDERDEPAGLLLTKIKTEKEKLIRDKKIKKNKPLPLIKEEEIPFDLPEGWVWVRLSEIVEFNPRNSIDDSIEVSFIPMKLIQEGFNNKHYSESKRWVEIKKGFTHFKEKDIAFAKITPCFENRKSVVMTNLLNGYGAGTTELIILRTYNELVVPEFLLYLVKTEEFISLGISSYTGTAGQQRVKTEKFEHFILGLPPLAEQKRIVRKVNQFMSLSVQFESQINQNQKHSNALLNTILREAFEIGENKNEIKT